MSIPSWFRSVAWFVPRFMLVWVCFCIVFMLALVALFYWGI